MVWPNTETALSKKWVEKQRDLDCVRLEGRGLLINGQNCSVRTLHCQTLKLVQRQ